MRNDLLVLALLLPCHLIAQYQETPVQAKGYYKQAESFLEESDPETAIVFFDKAAVIFEEYRMWEDLHHAQRQLIDANLGLGRYEEAKALAKKNYWEGFKRFGQKNPYSAGAALQLAEAYAKNGQQEKGTSFLRRRGQTT